MYFPLDKPWAGAEFVGGTPMVTHTTAQGALEDWLFEHGAVFGEDAMDFEVTHSLEWGQTRTFMRFVQVIDGISAPESFGRAIAHKDGHGNWSLSFVRCAALRAPQGGLPERAVNAEQAKAIAATLSMAARGELISEWGEPTLLLAASFGGAHPREARQIWQLYGADPQWRTPPVGVRVDAVTGDIVSEWEAVANFTDTVSGNVNGLVLVGEEPYETILPCTDYDTTTVGIPRMLVELADEPEGAAVATTFTDDNGDYEFTGVTIGQDTVVRFVMQHQHFNLGLVTVSSLELLDSVEVAVPGNGQVPTYTYIDTRSMTPSTEYTITDMSAWTVIHATREFYKINNQYIPGIDDDELWVVANETLISGLQAYMAGYWWPTSSPGFGVPVITFMPERSDLDLPNFAYSTVLSHEYGHFAFDQGFGITYHPNTAIHEAYADILSILHHDTDIVGYAGLGCTSSTVPHHFRDWTSLSLGDECASSPYERARHLVIPWLTIRDEIDDLAETSELLVKWSFLATPEPAGTGRFCYDEGIAGSENIDLAAREATFYEVLIADDDDASLNNGTPNDAAICAGFALIGLPTTPYSPCNDSARPGRCPVDFDGDGVFTIFDMMVLEQWAQKGNPRADVNGDGRIDLFDRLAALELGARCW